MPEEADNSYVVRAVDDALSVVIAVANAPSVGLSELARRTGLTKAKTFRLLRTLERRQMVWQDAEGRYHLGNTALLLGTAAASQIDLVRVASPVLERLCDTVNETVQLRLRDGNEAMCIAKFEPTRDLRVHVNIGRRRPLTAGSSKTILAFMPRKEQEALVDRPLERFTPNTIVDRQDLYAELERIRDAGYGISRGEVSEQLVAVAAPIFDLDGQVGSAINVVTPAFRLEPGGLEAIVAAVRKAADEISTGLGHRIAAAPLWRPPLDG